MPGKVGVTCVSGTKCHLCLGPLANLKQPPKIGAPGKNEFGI
jgi:hypothetical protein